MEPCKEHSGVEKAIENLESSDHQQWESIKKIQNRPPIWATALISVLTFALGCSITYASLVVRLAKIGN